MDYLNKKKKRNEKNTTIHSYNCGGYALRTYSWYQPYNDEEDFVWDLGNLYMGEEELARGALESCVDYMLEEFGEDLRVVADGEYDPQTEELIAFRTSTDDETDSYDWPDFDFHFKVFRDGKWMEKCGTEEIREADPDNWIIGCYVYNSDTVYLAHKVA